MHVTDSQYGCVNLYASIHFGISDSFIVCFCLDINSEAGSRRNCLNDGLKRSPGGLSPLCDFEFPLVYVWIIESVNAGGNVLVFDR